MKKTPKKLLKNHIRFVTAKQNTDINTTKVDPFANFSKQVEDDEKMIHPHEYQRPQAPSERIITVLLLLVMAAFVYFSL